MTGPCITSQNEVSQVGLNTKWAKFHPGQGTFNFSKSAPRAFHTLGDFQIRSKNCFRNHGCAFWPRLDTNTNIGHDKSSRSLLCTHPKSAVTRHYKWLRSMASAFSQAKGTGANASFTWRSVSQLVGIPMIKKTPLARSISTVSNQVVDPGWPWSPNVIVIKLLIS